MKQFAPLLLAVAVVALGAGFLHEYRQASYLQALVAQMEKDAAGAREQANADSMQIHQIKEQVTSYKAANEQLEAHNKELAKAATKGGDGDNGSGETGKDGSGTFMKGLAKMMNDPKMREAMKGQQAAAVNMLYGGLAKELQLAPDDARHLLALLTDRQLDLAAKGMKAYDKTNASAADLKTAGEETDAMKKSYDDQIKAMLGDDGFAKFQDYEKTAAQRIALDQLQRQLSASGTPLDDGQSQSLLQIMKDESAKMAASPLAQGSGNSSSAQMQALQSDDAVNAFLQAQQDANRRILDRARTVLSPDQMIALENAQKQYLQMQQMGVKMGREMMKK